MHGMHDFVTSQPSIQVLWLTGEMVKTGVAGADKLCFALLKQLPAGSTQQGELYIAENLMHILLDNRLIHVNSCSACRDCTCGSDRLLGMNLHDCNICFLQTSDLTTCILYYSSSAVHVHVHFALSLFYCTCMPREWMDSQPGLISSVVYTYLSLLPFHGGPSLTNLREQEIHMCVSLIRTRVTLLVNVHVHVYVPN